MFTDYKPTSDIKAEQISRKRRARNLPEKISTAKPVVIKRTKEEWAALVKEARNKNGIYYGEPGE